ncbi:MAG TPA: hypothetical protein VKJ07_22125, partial [Mycobacteriales bacterium]|nr:hypothetical protein [Mycobacteriales bacterium]
MPSFRRAVCSAALILTVGCTSSARPAAPVVAPCPSATPTSSPSHPNIVFVLADDLSTNLIR